MSPLNSVPFFEKGTYIKMEQYSNFCTYLRKYGKSKKCGKTYSGKQNETNKHSKLGKTRLVV